MPLPTRPSHLIEAATYQREIAANLDRAWENVLDWEHLTWVHSSSFSDLEFEDAGDWGWRVKLGADKNVVELTTDRPNERYVSRTLSGPGKGTEVWTYFMPLAPHRTQVNVAFWLNSALGEEKAKKVGQSYIKHYTLLWNEDEEMMVERQRQIDRAAAGTKQGMLTLGPESSASSVPP
ncbi:MAG: hypothetical protein AAF512_17505 [Pseudomonadota bacterium]